MTAFNIFKKNKPVADKPVAKKPEKKELIKEKSRDAGIAYRVLKSPLISEKAVYLAEQNQYVFKVWPRANKNEIKSTVESLYNVNVVSVAVITIPQKEVRLGKTSGWKGGGKKAIVRIQAGQKIEVLPR